jgi:hypothetical protein
MAGASADEDCYASSGRAASPSGAALSPSDIPPDTPPAAATFSKIAFVSS